MDSSFSASRFSIGEKRQVSSAAGGRLQEFWIRGHPGDIRSAPADKSGDGKIQLADPRPPTARNRASRRRAWRGPAGPAAGPTVPLVFPVGGV